MNDTHYLYLVKTIENNKVQFTTNVQDVDGVMLTHGLVCAVLKRYATPVDIDSLLMDIQKIQTISPLIAKRIIRNVSDTTYVDHLGNEFETVFQMCMYHKVSESKYRSRISHGWSLEEALTGVRKSKQMTDHLGNLFNSKSDMCHYYGISVSQFNTRISAGHSVEEALLGVEDTSEATVTDHLGNSYKNVSQMCRAYGVRLDLYCHRKNRGYTLEEILTGKKKAIPVTDHTGTAYPDIEDMCAEYGIKITTYQNRIKAGWSIEEALTGIRKGRAVTDYLGNIYRSTEEMCRWYGVRCGTFRKRLENGWSLEQALTTDTSKDPSKRKRTAVDSSNNNSKATKIAAHRNSSTKQKSLVTDHLGNKYSNTKEMCNAYGIKVDTFKDRIEHGHSLQDALTRVPASVFTKIACQDHWGNHFDSHTEMAHAYGITTSQFYARKRLGWSIEKILTTPINSNSNQNTSNVTDASNPSRTSETQ